MDRTTAALKRMAREDPELAARVVIQMLPAAAARIEGPLRYELVVDGLGTWRIDANGESTDVCRLSNGASPDDAVGDEIDFRLATTPRGLARMAAGTHPLRLVLRGDVRIRGHRRRALKLRAMADGEEPTIADAIRAGAPVDADAIYRALAYLIDPEWTRGHRFVAAFDVRGAGTWFVEVRDGEPLRVTTDPPAARPDIVTTMDAKTYRRLLAGEITPNEALRDQLSRVEGKLYYGVLMGRWIERAQGRDDAELERERRQRVRQAERAGSWGGARNGTPLPAPRPVTDPGNDGSSADGAGRDGGGERRDLMDHPELYALWERQNWKAHELDFSVDREQWATMPSAAQEDMTWSLGSFYIGEERVTADLAPFLLAAPTGEIEVFLATQLVDEARHAAFFDRFGAEVMALDAEDLRGRMRELEARMRPPWFEVFDDGLRDVAKRIQARPDDFELFVEGITTYHLVIEGVLATTGQRFILDYIEGYDIYPGFHKGFSLVEQDEHRHIAFGVRFLRDAIASDPRYGEVVMRTVERLVPRAAHVFFPPYADDPADFVSYGYHSSQIYGYAYRKLKRRMRVLGLEAPPPEDLMPGPLASAEEARAAGAPV